MIYAIALFIAFCTGVIAYVYVHVLCNAEMILGRLFYIVSGIAQRHPWTEPLLKPLMLCALCVSGQMGLWVFAFFTVRHHLAYDFGAHLTCICLSILFTKTFQKLYE